MKKIRMLYFRLRWRIDDMLEIVSRILAIAKIVRQNRDDELVRIVKMYKTSGNNDAHTMLMFFDWQMKSVRTDITSGHGIVNVRFNLKGWK